MENILKKALREVLTTEYSEALSAAYDTGYKFSEKFENDMDSLIRKTDRLPIYRYRGWITAAACAVLAVGAAVLIPTLTRNTVEVTETDITSATETTPAATEPTVTTTLTTVTEDDTAVTEDTSGSSEPEPTVVIDEKPSETEQTTAASSEPPATQSSVSETTVSSNDNKEEAAVVDNDGDDDSDDDITLDDDDTVVTDEAAGETFNISVPAGKTMNEVFSENFGITFDSLWADYAEYCPTGSHAVGKYSYINCSNAEYTFIQDFVHRLGNAESEPNGFAVDEGEPQIYISVTARKPKVENYASCRFNSSSWLYYDRFFNGSEDYDDDAEDSDDLAIADDKPESIYPRFKICVCKNSGGIMLNSYIEYYNEKTKKTDLYGIGTYKMNKEDVAALFTGFEKMYLSEEPQTVSDITSGLGISAGNIITSYAGIDHIYDTYVGYADIKPAYVDSFFTKFADKKLTPTTVVTTNTDGSEYSVETEVNGEVTFNVILKSYAGIKVTLNLDGKCFIQNGRQNEGKGWYFDITFDDIKDVIKAVADANGYNISFYSTLGEYLEGKHFDTLDYVECIVTKDDGKMYQVTVTDENELKVLYDMIKSETEAEYLPDFWGGLFSEVNVKVNGYMSPISLKKDDILYIHTLSHNHFKLSAGFNEKFRKAIESSKNAKWELIEVAPDDDDDDEETIPPVDD